MREVLILLSIALATAAMVLLVFAPILYFFDRWRAGRAPDKSQRWS